MEVWVPAVLISAALIWFLVIPAWRNLSGALHAASWSEVQGLVTVSKEIRTFTQERYRTTYSFKYRYRVGNEDYHSSRFSFQNPSGSPRHGVAEYDVGDEVVVYYDPDDPSQSVVQRDASAWWNYFVLACLFLIPIALYIRVRNLNRFAARQTTQAKLPDADDL